MRGKCIICGSATREVLHKKFHLNYHYCDICGFISKDAKNRISLEEELEIYRKHNNSIDDPRYVAYFKDFINSAVIDFVSSGRSGLDFGSGPSPVLAMILDRDYGFEMDIYDLFFAPNKVFSGKKYHLITSTEVFEHLGDPLEYFKLLAGCLEDDGLLSIMTLFHPLDDEEFLDWYYIRDMSHISFYANDTMKVISEIAGLDLVFTDNRRYTSFRLKR